jgi:hypothetical protein
LRTRVEGSVNSFLNKQVWKPDLNKNQLRETLRKHIHDAPYLDAGVERIVDQVVNPKVYSVFMSQIEDVVYKFLGIEKPKTKEKNGACGLKDLLPKDLDPVSPASDKISLKDVSLESIDANDNLNEKQEDKECNEQKLQNEEIYGDKNRKLSSENGYISLDEKLSDEVCKTLNKTSSNLNLNISGKSDDKLEEEEEEVSPTFEPIDIMNLNECNISNDSHLSGISELTSHRSRSPDFSNELSRDNFDCSNQDSQLSKVSSDSRLSIVTDFGSSNHGLTPVHDASRDEATKYEAKNNKDNFKAIREFELSKNKTIKGNFDFAKNKDTQDYKDSKDYKSKSMSSKENSRDAVDSGIKDKYEHKSSKEKNKDGESVKSSKSIKEKTSNKDEKYYKDKSNEKKKSSSHSSTKYDKHSKNKIKDKTDQIRENSDKAKDISENLKDNANKFKDEKLKETDKKDNNKEAKDLKDLYKEKIRELREKKELTEKEKLNKDKDIKVIKDIKDKKDSPKDRKSSRKEHRSSSSSSSSRNISVNHHETKNSKTLERTTDGKDKRSDPKDKARRDEKRSLKDSKGKSHYSSKTDISDRSDKSDMKRTSKNEKEDKAGKADAKKNIKIGSEKMTNDKKDTKNHAQRNKSSERNEKLENKKDSKNDSPSKDKKRREDKKSKMKDDHSSLRKNSNDRRSTDRDGSNGSNSKTSPSNNSSSNTTSNKSSTSTLTKEDHINNPNETSSDSIEEVQVSDMKSLHQSNCKLSHKVSLQLSKNDKSHSKMESDNIDETYNKQEEEQTYVSCDTNLNSRKRLNENDESACSDMKIKKPKFARNIHEAKKLMKIRKQMEKQKHKEDKKEEKKVMQEIEQTDHASITNAADNLENMPDYERVQIIEVRDEEYEEPYPEKHEPNLMLDERSLIMLGAESCPNDILDSNLKSTLSNMELCIKQSLSEIVSNVSLERMVTQNTKINEKITKSQSADDSFQQSSTSSCNSSLTYIEKDLQASKEMYKDEMLKSVNVEQYYSQTDETHVSQKQKETAISEKSISMDYDKKKNMKTRQEENADAWNSNRAKTQHDNEKTRNDNRSATQDNNEESQNKKQIEMISSRIDVRDSSCNRIGSLSPVTSEEECRYFKTDNEKSEKFFNFLESLELNSSLEDIIESLGGKVVSSLSKSMAAPPLPKRKNSSSPLSDILMNNSDNNNDGHKRTLSSSPNEDTVHNVKKKKFAKKPRLSSLCNPQGILNGENFVMPLSPDSDVSATSDKTASSNMIKEERRYN